MLQRKTLGRLHSHKKNTIVLCFYFSYISALSSQQQLVIFIGGALGHPKCL